METLPLIFLGILGLCAGSFAYAMTLRMYDGRDWVRGHSECDLCHAPLRWYDLIPLFSWLSTKGTCRYCKKRIGYGFPLVELATATSFMISYYWWPYGFTRLGYVLLIVWLVMLTLLISLVIFDLKWKILPDKLVYPLIGIAMGSKLAQVAYFQDVSILLDVMLSILVGAGVFYLLYAVSDGRYIGGGDVKYGVFFGILLASPFKSLLVISIGSIIGTLCIIPSALNRKTKLESQVPFGPSLIVATFIMYIFGDRIVELLTSTYLFP